jgi:hypothetical protein
VASTNPADFYARFDSILVDSRKQPDLEPR